MHFNLVLPFLSAIIIIQLPSILCHFLMDHTIFFYFLWTPMNTPIGFGSHNRPGHSIFFKDYNLCQSAHIYTFFICGQLRCLSLDVIQEHYFKMFLLIWNMVLYGFPLCRKINFHYPRFTQPVMFVFLCTYYLLF